MFLGRRLASWCDDPRHRHGHACCPIALSGQCIALQARTGRARRDVSTQDAAVRLHQRPRRHDPRCLRLLSVGAFQCGCPPLCPRDLDGSSTFSLGDAWRLGARAPPGPHRTPPRAKGRARADQTSCLHQRRHFGQLDQGCLSLTTIRRETPQSKCNAFRVPWPRVRGLSKRNLLQWDMVSRCRHGHLHRKLHDCRSARRSQTRTVASLAASRHRDVRHEFEISKTKVHRSKRACRGVRKNSSDQHLTPRFDLGFSSFFRGLRFSGDLSFFFLLECFFQGDSRLYKMKVLFSDFLNPLQHRASSSLAVLGWSPSRRRQLSFGPELCASR